MDQESYPQSWIKWALGVAGLGAAAPFFTTLPTKAAIVIAAIVVGLLVILIGGYVLWLYLKKRKAKARFGAIIGEGVKGAPTGIDAKGLADLDALRKKFQEGVQAYKSRGKDLYSLPWYLLVGESSAGKTEAVRHCGVGFPPGLTDYLQGTGGTINMHWWFTNSAVVLDTAGKMMFAGVNPGESSLWQEFLRLLKRARPYCPINGLLLVLPVDSLIKDSANKISEKATLIAKQLDLVQRTLDVRFPVFVLVTKCDLLTGFREYFGGMDDIEATQQMVGWSNPDPLDAPFRPEIVDQHLEQVADRLRRRRMAMLRDPAETGPSHSRRTDAVDALFALPQSLLLVAPRLKRYLQTIFVAGEWAPKPVFLRGIYFTSSLQQGSPLDEALAALRGVSPEEMYRDSSDEREEKTFFLYDLFTEKVFQEKGLITRATNTLVMLSKRRWTLLGAGAAALLLLISVSSFGYFKLKRSIGQEALLWQAATNNWTAAGAAGLWNPIVLQATNSGGLGSEWRYAGGDSQPGLERTLVEFHQDLHNVATQSNSVPWIFWPIRKWVSSDNRREKAAWLVFEKGVVQPLLDTARGKMSVVAVTNQIFTRNDWHAEALISLIKVERDLIPKYANRKLEDSEARTFLNSLVRWVAETNFSAPTNLSGLLAAYSERKRDEDSWLPVSRSGGGRLGTNVAIKNGLSQFFTNAKRSNQELKIRFGSLTQVWEAAREFRDAEMRLQEAVHGPDRQVEPAVRKLADATMKLDSALTNATASGLSSPRQELWLRTNYTKITEDSRRLSGQPLSNLSLAVSTAREGILGEIRDNISGHQRMFEREFEVDPRLAILRDELDTNFLARHASNLHYGFRAGLYGDSAQFRMADSNVVGTSRDGWREYSSSAEGITRRFTTYEGERSNDLRRTCEAFLRIGVFRFVQNRNEELTNMLGFPVLWDDTTNVLSYEKLKALNQFIEAISSVLSIETFTKYADNEALGRLRGNVLTVSNVVSAFCGDAKGPTLTVKVDLGGKNLEGSALGDLRHWKVQLGEESAGWQNVALLHPALAVSTLGKDKPLTIECRRPTSSSPGFTEKFSGGLVDWLANAARTAEIGFDAESQRWSIPVKLPKGTVYVDVTIGATTTQLLPTTAKLPPLGRWPRKKDLK